MGFFEGIVGESIRGCMLEEGTVLLKSSFEGSDEVFLRVLLSGQWSASVKKCIFIIEGKERLNR